MGSRTTDGTRTETGSSETGAALTRSIIVGYTKAMQSIGHNLKNQRFKFDQGSVAPKKEFFRFRFG